MKGQAVHRCLVTLLLLVHFALLVFSVGMKSPTLDEQNHVARGLAYLKTGDLRLSQEHPPGVNVWQAWPLLLDPSLRLPLDSPSWANAEWYGFADRLLWRDNDRPQAMIFATRVPVMWLTIVLAALVYRWACELGGRWAAGIALALLTFDPNILAHGRLTTTDIGVTCLAFAAMYALWRALRERTWKRWVLVGICFGASQLAKFSALVLVPVVLLTIAVTIRQGWVRRKTLAAEELGRWALRLLALLCVDFAVVWASYRFTWGTIALRNGIPGPAPAYWAGVQAILRRTSAGSPAFLMGQHSREGWWYYFPVAFAIKTPLPTLILLATALWLWGRRRLGKSAARQTGGSQVVYRQPLQPPNHPTAQPHDYALCLVLPLLAFWIVALVGSFNIGYRHILPSLPFIYVLAGWQLGKRATRQMGRPADRGPGDRSHDSRLVSLLIPFIGLSLLWLAVGTISVVPHYLAFFNALAGGPDGGYRYLVDSNLDWGQDLPGLKRYVEAQGIERIYLSWFGAAHPEAYGFPFHPLPGFWRFGGEPAAYGLNPYAPAPGTYAISASNLQGLAFADHDIYAWFREQTPVAHVGHSILIYRVKGRATYEEAVVLGVPMAQLANEERILLQRSFSVRRYDPRTGFILPLGATAFWTIAPQPLEWGQIVREGPGYAVIHSSGGESPPPDTGARCARFVTLRHHQIEQLSLGSDRMLSVQAQWGIEEAPHRSAVSFAHLLDAQGRYVAGWDGLTSPATCWQRGDLIRQEYDLALPTDLAPGLYPIEIGWYDGDTLERWPCYVADEFIGDRLLLPDVEIRS